VLYLYQVKGIKKSGSNLTS